MTSGRIRVVCAPEAVPLIAREGDAFEVLYPDAAIEVVAGTSRDAVSALFAAESDLAVIGRELEPEEREASAAGELDLQGYRFARDACVLVVHPDNPVENVTVEDLRSIYRGEYRNWEDLGGADRPIVAIAQAPETDLSGFIVHELLDGEAPGIPARVESSDSAVVAAVLRDAGALGYVSLAGVDLGARPLRVAPLRGLSYWKPDLEAVYKGDYPLTRYFNVFVRADGRRLAHGFITFVTSTDGQRLVHETGLVPTTVPVRFVRRSPMKSTHDQ